MNFHSMRKRWKHEQRGWTEFVFTFVLLPLLILHSNQHERNRRNKPKKQSYSEIMLESLNGISVRFCFVHRMWVCSVEAVRSNGRNRTHDTTVTAKSGSLRFEWQITVGRFVFPPFSVNNFNKWRVVSGGDALVVALTVVRQFATLWLMKKMFAVATGDNGSNRTCPTSSAENFYPFVVVSALLFYHLIWSFRIK